MTDERQNEVRRAPASFDQRHSWVLVRVEAAPLDVEWAALEAAIRAYPGWLNEQDRWVVPTGTWTVAIQRVESGDGCYEPCEEAFLAWVEIAPGHTVAGEHENSPAGAVRSLAAAIAHERTEGAETPQHRPPRPVDPPPPVRPNPSKSEELGWRAQARGAERLVSHDDPLVP